MNRTDEFEKDGPRYNPMLDEGNDGEVDDDFIKSPFKEAPDGAFLPPRLTFDLVKTLGHMSSKIGISKRTLISESDEALETLDGDQNGEA